jgi:hypothetical protein
MLHYMVTILVRYGGHIESKMAAKIQKSSDLVKIWFPSRSWSCELIIVIVFGIGSHGVGWCPLLLCNGNLVLIIIFPHIFVRSISRRCLDQTLWNLVGISYAMWSCAVKGWFFFNFCRCHGNGQNAKKLKNTKMITGYSPNRNWWNLIGTASTSSSMR